MRAVFEEVDKEDKEEDEGWRKEGEVEDEDGDPEEDKEEPGADDHRDEHGTRRKPDEDNRMKAQPPHSIACNDFIVLAPILNRKII